MADSDKEELVKFSSRDGTKIACFRNGQGPPLVLVNGTASDHSRWKPILPTLQETNTVYAVDRRGRGASGDTKEYSIEREFEDIATILDSIDEPVNLLGHSYGGLCSLEASLISNNLNKLILYEPPIPLGIEFIPPGLVDRLQALLDNGEREFVYLTFNREVVRMPENELMLMKSLPGWEGRIAAAHTIPRELKAVESYVFEPEHFTGVKIPTLLLMGSESPRFLKVATEALCKILPNNRIEVLDEQQHDAMDTAKELFLAKVLKFLDHS